MRIFSMLKPVALALAALCLAPAAMADEREALCGWSFPVESYHAQVGGLDIALTANDRIAVGGSVVIETDDVRPWGDSINTASLALIGDEVLIRTYRTDCVDRAVARIYVLYPRGGLRAWLESYSPHESEGVIRETSGALIYWSESFCRAAERAPEINVLVLAPEARHFLPETRPRDQVCGVQARVNSAQFNGMQPE